MTPTLTPSPARRPAPPRLARPPAARIRHAADVAVILLFAVGLAVGLYGAFVREQPPLIENRNRHPLPPLTGKKHVIQDFPKWFDLYFGDRVGYRDVLLAWHQRVMYHGFDEPVTNLGWIGRDGWLFLNVDDPLRGLRDQPSIDERIERWADTLADRHAYLKARGIRYMVLVPPDKSSVYPEFLRGAPARHPPPAPAARLAELLAARGVPCVDPLPALLAAKPHTPDPLFYQLDSHWTFTGARVAYERLAREIPVSPLGEDGYTVEQRTFPGDLGRLVGAPESEWQESARCFVVRERVVTRDDTPEHAALLPPEVRDGHLKPRLYTCPQATGPAVMFFHDSFGEQLLAYLPADCRRLTTVPSDKLELGVIDAEKPAVVVQEIVARKLYQLTPTNPPEVSGYSKR